MNLEIGGTGKLSDLCHMSQLVSGGAGIQSRCSGSRGHLLQHCPSALLRRVSLATEGRVDHGRGGWTWGTRQVSGESTWAWGIGQRDIDDRSVSAHRKVQKTLIFPLLRFNRIAAHVL